MSDTSHEDNEAYREYLKLIHDSAFKEYGYYALDWRNRQTSLLKTYLWLSFTIIVAQANIFPTVWNGESLAILPWSLSPSVRFYFFVFIAAITSLSAFAFGIDSLRGRGGVHSHYKMLHQDMMMHAYSETISKEVTPFCLYVNMISNLQDAIHHQKEQNRLLAIKLRTTSYLLLTSILFTAASLLP